MKLKARREFGVIGDTKRLIKRLRSEGVEITRGSLRRQLPSGYYPSKMIADPAFDEARAVAPKSRFISVGRGETKEASAGMGPIQTLWHEAGHARRQSSQINPNNPKYKNKHQIAAERGANRAAMGLLDEVGASGDTRRLVRSGLKKSYKTYKAGSFEDLHYTTDRGKEIGERFLKPRMAEFYNDKTDPSSGLDYDRMYDYAKKISESLSAKKDTLRKYPYLRGYGFSAKLRLRELARGEYLRRLIGYLDPVPARGAAEAVRDAGKLRHYRSNPVGREIERVRKEIIADPHLGKAARYKDTPALTVVTGEYDPTHEFPKRSRQTKWVIDNLNKHAARGKSWSVAKGALGQPIVRAEGIDRLLSAKLRLRELATIL